ncbi:MAG TPA: twin-arginine translocase TatA/TatE family subunit [Anaerolineae bacterium]|nr:twin-arginine translocase TatA/TatE family subunit [Anaerolineae bacterium]
MNIFGVGPTEIFVVLIVILVLFGPDKLPEMARKIGGASRELRGGLDAINEQMNNALEVSMEMDKARMTPPAPDTVQSESETNDSASVAVIEGTLATPAQPTMSSETPDVVSNEEENSTSESSLPSTPPA